MVNPTDYGPRTNLHFALCTSQHRKAIFALLIVFAPGCHDPRDTDTVKVLSEKPSPNGKLIVASFYCEGGGAAGYCYNNVSLRRAGEELNQRDGLLGKHKTWSGFSDIKLGWIDDSKLEISYTQETLPAYREHNSVRVESAYGVTIHYVVRGEDVSE